MVEESDIKYDEVARKLAMVRKANNLDYLLKIVSSNYHIRWKVISREQKRELDQVTTNN